MCQESDGWPRPFAVGILALETAVKGTGRTAAARLDLALGAYRLGYFLIDTLEIDSHGTGYLAAELLVSHAAPDALVTWGSVDTGWLNALADRHPVTIHSCDENPRPSRDVRRELLLRRRRG